ncbi:MAG: TolC family protein [Verrucomicrobia bacterium]|nr:MAG: TolC family protein [Verrucomicrobiota bacterium]
MPSKSKEKRQRTGALQDASRVSTSRSAWRSFWTGLPFVPCAPHLTHLTYLTYLTLSAATALSQTAAPLTLQEARETALHNHPKITQADLRALASRQAAKQVQAGFFPNVSLNAVAVGTADLNTRLGAVASLSNPSIFERNAEGLLISQLITDFGHTSQLTSSAKLRARAQTDNAQAAREQLLLAVDGAFFGAEQAQAVTRVAQKTVSTRQTFLDQVTALASNQLRSELDVSFARVNVEEARLLLSKAQNDLQASFAQLANLMGLSTPPTNYNLAEVSLRPQSTNDAGEFIGLALRTRPEVLSLRHERDAAIQYARAQHSARYPSISALAAGGLIPIRQEPQLPDKYAAAGVSMTMPLFAGGYYTARQREAELQADAASETLRELELNVVRDVRVAWLNAQNAFDRLRITSQLLENARQSFNLAQIRYKNGLSSIVEFNQAELNLVSAEINQANTQYEYQIQRSILDFQSGALR